MPVDFDGQACDLERRQENTSGQIDLSASGAYSSRTSTSIDRARSTFAISCDWLLTDRKLLQLTQLLHDGLYNVRGGRYIMPLFTQFSGTSKPRQINLSGRPASSQPSNSETLLAKAREERRARERNRLEITSVLCIQRVWRGRRAAQEARDRLRTGIQGRLSQPDLNSEEWTYLNRALMLVLWNERVKKDDGKDYELLLRWCSTATKTNSSQFDPLS